MNVIKAPNDIHATRTPALFLAGSIEMGKAVDWQTELTNRLEHLEIAIFNPRRDDWDSSWKQDIKNDKFREQVEWELDALARANVIAMYFDPKTQSPISLLELGLYASSGKLIVCCPEGYWRKGNVDVVCANFRIPQVKTIEELAVVTEYEFKKRIL